MIAERPLMAPLAITRSANHQYTYAGKTYPGVTSILKVIDKSDALMAWAARNTAEAALAQLGTDVHALADRVANGEPDIIVPENVRRHVHGYAEWWAASGWTVRTTEAYLVNPEHGYGGTLDLLCRDRDGRTVLADIKTGKGVYAESVLQLTAYGAASLIQTPAGQLFPMPTVDRYAILHVTADGVREIEVPVGTLEQLAWAACIDLFTWKETTKGKRL